MSSTTCSVSSSNWQGVDAPPSIDDWYILEEDEGFAVYIDEEVLDVQSGETPFGISIDKPAKGTKEQNVSFNDQNPAFSYSVDSQPDSSFGQADLMDAQLGDFFCRPIKIADYEWGVNQGIFQDFNPWTLYFGNTRIVNRIANFSLLRAKLHLKVLINGNGFHYGRAILSYLPLHKRDDFTRDREFFREDIVQASQRPHIYLDPTTSQGGDMCLPFFWYKNALSIPEAEWDDMGKCTLAAINNLKHANGADDRVTISVFAWAEDVVLSMPTATNPDTLSPQCEEVELDVQADEYGEGIISKPASLVSRWAGRLTSIPTIGPYARATEIAAGATAQIAKMFGFSRPAVLQDIVPYKPTLVGNLANVNVPDSVQRLTLDAKQEITIDPRTTGLGSTDEMAIVPLAMRESYVTTFSWPVDGARSQAEDLLWNSEVTPMMYAENDTPALDEIHMTPSCWVTMPFRMWRGSMEFRFQIVASQYHKGRIKIVWDPYYPETNEYVTNYTWILDLAEEKDCTVKVGWGNKLAYCTTREPGLGQPPYRESKLVSIPGSAANGILSVYVVNRLTVPNSVVNNDISINVFTKMCDDFEVGNPFSNRLESYSYLAPPGSVPERKALLEKAIYPKGLGALSVKIQEQKDEEYERRKGKPSADPPQSEIDDAIRKYTELAPDLLDTQSAEEAIVKGDQEDTTDPSKPITTESDGALGDVALDPADHALDVFFGEAIVSLRQLLKRYTYHTSFGTFMSGQRYYIRRSNNLPYYRGYSATGVHEAAGVPYNRCKMTLINWIMPAYTGWRGATRWKYVRGKELMHPLGSDPSVQHAYMSVRRLGAEKGPYLESQPLLTTYDDPSTTAFGAMEAMGHTADGNTATVATQNAVLEVETPYYTHLRFGTAKDADRTGRTGFNFYHELETISVGEENSGAGMQIDSYCAVGEDFSLFFFTGAPIVFRVGSVDPGSP